MSEYYHSHCSELSHKRTRSMWPLIADLRLLELKFARVLYFISLFNFSAQFGPGTKYRSPKFWMLSLQVILDFVQAVLILPSTRSPQVAELVRPELAHPLCQSLHSLSEPVSFLQVSSLFPGFYFLFSCLIKISFLRAFSPNLFLSQPISEKFPTYLVLVSSTWVR